MMTTMTTDSASGGVSRYVRCPTVTCDVIFGYRSRNGQVFVSSHGPVQQVSVWPPTKLTCKRCGAVWVPEA